MEGAGAVIVAACHHGNCRSMSGSRTAALRTAKLAAQLGAEEKIAVNHHYIAANEPARMVQIVSVEGSIKEKPHA
jgi:coenzyme F420-reducing hydrogenase delta subunit